MLYISHDFTEPYFNLASEEYLIKDFKEDIFMLWRNKPSIIVGRNQNTLSEINIDYVKQNSIPVVRRLSGGGAVFHDLGNLNFTFISNEGGFNDFKRFTQPILDVLKMLSINAEFSGRNDLTIDGKKFSGNAQYNYKHRILHHGTLLFSSTVEDLSSSLKVNSSKFEGKGIKSVKSRVTNISQHIKRPITILEFRNMIMNHIMNINNKGCLYTFNDIDIKKINYLVDEKYNTWEWNFGSSPEYNFTSKIKYTGGNIEFNINVKDGFISHIKIYGDFFGKLDISNIEDALIGVKYANEDIKKALLPFDIGSYFSGIKVETLIDGLI